MTNQKPVASNSQPSQQAEPPQSQTDSLEDALELQLQREDELREYRQAANDGAHGYAPTHDGLCYSCKAFLPALHAQGYRCMTGCPKCHRSFVE